LLQSVAASSFSLFHYSLVFPAVFISVGIAPDTVDLLNGFSAQIGPQMHINPSRVVFEQLPIWLSIGLATTVTRDPISSAIAWGSFPGVAGLFG